MIIMKLVSNLSCPSVFLLPSIILTSLCPGFADLSATVMYKITEDMCGVDGIGK